MNGSQNQNQTSINTNEANLLQEQPVLGSDALSLEPIASAPAPSAITRAPSTFTHTYKKVFILVAILFAVSAGATALLIVINLRKPKDSAANNNIASQYSSQHVSLQDLVAAAQGIDLGFGNVVINGGLKANNGIVLSPNPKPSAPSAGQLYFDQQTNQLSFYNGQQYASLGEAVVQGIGGASGSITLGNGLSMVGNQLTATFPTGLSSTGGGTTGRLAKFTGAQNIADSLVNDNGTVVTIAGDLTVTGSLGLATPLAVGNGGTGAGSLAANGVVIGQGTNALATAIAGGAGLCLVSTAGAPAFQACPGSGGVASLNGLSGVLTLANASGAGSTITIDDATTAAKGIASFNASNFTASAGAVNTIQDIGTSASPTFGGATISGTANLNGDTTLGASSTNRLHINSEIVAGSLILQGATDDAFALTLNISDPTANRTITIPNTSGTLPVATSGSSQNGVSAFVQNGSTWNGAANLGTNDAFDLNFRTNTTTRLTVTSTGDLTFASGAGNFDQSSSTGTFKTGTGAISLNGDTTVAAGKLLTANGAVLLQNSADSTSALQVKNAAGTAILLNADTSNARIGIGTAAPSKQLHVVAADSANPVTAKIQNTNGAPGAGTTESRLMLATSATLTDETTGAAVTAHRTGGAGNGSADLYLQTSNSSSTLNTQLTVTSTGAITAKNSANSTTAFQVQNVAGDTYLGIDTSGAIANFGNVNIASTVNVGTTGAGAAVAQTVRVGTNATAGATNTVIIGNSAATASTVTINGGTGAGAVSLQAGASGTISIGTSNAVTLAFGSTAANGATFTSKSSTTGFQIQNASSVALFTVDTTNARLYVGPVAGDTVGTILVLGKKTTAGDPTGVEGAMYYNSSSLTMRCYQDGIWSDCLTANPIDRSFTVQDDFTSGQSGSGTIGALGWQNTAISVAGTATYNSTTYLSATNPGILILTTPTTTNQGSTIRAAGGGVASWTLAAGNRFKSTVAEDNTAATTTLRIGLHAESSATARPTTGIWWEADPTNNANWEYCFGTGATATCAASSVAIASTTLVRTEIRLTATGSGTSSATFLINGNSYSVSAVTIDTATKVSPAMSCFTQANAAGVCAVDYVWAYGEAPNGR